MVVIGPTGVGKSTFCNVVSGKSHDDPAFPVSKDADSCTNKTTSVETKWKGDGFDLTLIDTPGLCDSSEDNIKNILGMVDELKKNNHVDVFVLVVNGNQEEFSAYFVNMILIFQLCFGHKFLETNTIVEVTKWPFNPAEVSRREKNDEDTLTESINKKLQEMIKTGEKVVVTFIDAVHNPENYNTEVKKYNEEMDKLENFLKTVEPYDCQQEKFKGVQALLNSIAYKNEAKDEEEKLKHEIEAKNSKIEEQKRIIQDLKRQLDQKKSNRMNWWKTSKIENKKQNDQHSQGNTGPQGIHCPACNFLGQNATFNFKKSLCTCYHNILSIAIFR